MKILRHRVPAEWSAQKAVWLTWPSMPNWWKGAREESLAAFATLAAEISKVELARINCPTKKSGTGFSDSADALERIIKAGGNPQNIEFFDHPTNDVWCRDSGAIFGLSEIDRLYAIDFSYNSWGGKFPPWELDDELAGKMAHAANAVRAGFRDIVCEGGALEFDGAGTVITTESVLLNPNRNPDMTRDDIEAVLRRACGVENFIWLKSGLCGDDTDGHVDNIARFAPNGKIAACVCDETNPSYAALQENLETLKNAHNAFGEPYEIVPLPLPSDKVEMTDESGETRELPASYANWLVTNGAVFVPSYAQKSDKQAQEIAESLFPKRKIIPLDCRVFLREGGAIHCLTQQEPESK